MQPAAPLLFPSCVSSSGPCLPQPQPATPVHQEKVAKTSTQTQSESCLPREPAAPPSRQVPHLRAVVESQAFKNILVDEMDLMVSRAATVIQANWKGYRLRQKLISQMTAAKAIQEAWRRFSTRRLMRSNKLTVRKAKKEEEDDIPYHPPQQVRFHAPEDQLPVMVSKEIQFPSSDNLVLSHSTAAGPCASGAPRGGLVPQQPVTGRFTGPKYPPCMLTKSVRSSCLVRHLEGSSMESRHTASRTIKSETPESAVSARYGQATHATLKTQTQVHMEADVPKAPLHMYPVNKTPTKVCPVALATVATVATAPKGPLQTYPTSPGAVMKMQPPSCPTSPETRPLAHVRPNPSFSSTPPQVRSVVPMARAQSPGSGMTSTVKASPRLGASVNRGPLQTGSGPMMTKTSPQMRSVTRSQPQTCAASSSSKASSQPSPTVKLSLQTRLAAMITRTPAQIRSVAAVLRTLCLVPTVTASSPKGSPQTSVVAGIPNAPSQVHLSSPKANVTVSTKQTTAVVKVTSQAYLAEEKGRCGPHGHLGTVTPKLPAKSPLEVEKTKPGPPRAPKKEAAPKTNMAIVARALSWTKVAEDRSRPLTQTQQKAEVVKVHSRVYMPEEMTVTLSQAQLAVPLTKATSQAQPLPGHPRPLPAAPLSKAVSQSSGLATGLPEGQCSPVGPSAALSSLSLAAHLMSLTTQLHPAGEQNSSMSRAPLATSCPATGSPQARSLGLTFVPPEGYPNTCPPASTSQYFHPTRNSLQPPPPAGHAKITNTKITKATCQVCPPSKLSKAPSLAQLITCLARVPSQAHLPMGLVKAQSQAQLTSETAKCLLAAHPATDLSGKAQSQPLLSTSKPSAQFWQYIGTLNTGPHAKPDDKSMTQPQLQSHVQNKATQNPRSVATDTQGMQVPLLTPSGHPVCNGESWGDSGQARTPPPPPRPSQAVSCHEDLAASIASLCADLVTMLGSTEDLRTLLAKTLSQGEVRTTLSQALSREVLGPSVVKALPQGMLGMALMKALSWGELGISLSRALSHGELRPELSKATQGKLAEVLCKALTEDERATLSQALCQGELGAVFTQSLAQMAQRTGTFLPKATSKTVGSRMTRAPAPVEVACSGSLSVAWGPALGPVRARCSKVRLLWKGLSWGQHDGILWGKGDGTTLEGSPCLPQPPVGSFSGGMVTSTYQCPPLSRERDLGYSSGLYLRPLDLDSMACGEGPHVPKRPSQQPPLCPWQPLVANGAGPSSEQPSVASSTAPSSQPPVASRVSYPWVSNRQGGVVASKHSSGVGGGKHHTSQWLPTPCQGSECQCGNLGTHKMFPCGRCSCRVKSRSSSPRQTDRQALPLGHRLMSPLGLKKMVTVVRNITDGVNSKVSSTSTPKQERHPQVSLTPSCPQGQATGHHMSLLDELLATFPQHPQMVLAKSFPRGSAAHCQNSSGSHSSLQSGSSGSPSSPPSLTPSEVLEGFREGDMQEGPQSVLKESREARHKPQGQLEQGLVGSQQAEHPSQQPPLELGSLLLHSTSLALNVHLDSDSGSEYSTRDLMEALSWDTTAPWGRSRQVHTQLDPPLPPDTLADGRAPSPGQAPEASEEPPCQSQPLEATGLCPSSPQPAKCSSVSPSLAQASMDTGVAPSLNHPPVAAKVFPTLAQPSMDTGVSPMLREPLIYYELPTNFNQPFLYCGGSPIYTQPYMASGVPSNFTQAPGTSVVALGNQAVNSGVASNQAQLCATTHMAPSVTQSPVNSWPPPGSSPMPVQGAGSPNSAQTSVATGVSPNFFQPLMPYSLPSNFTQPCLATIVTPNFVQPSMPQSVSASLAQPFVVSVMSPTLTHASMADRASPALRQPTSASGLVPGVLQMPLSNRAPPSLSSPLLAPRLCSNLVQTSVAALGTLSLLPPTVVCGMGHGNSKSALGPQQCAREDSSAAQSQPSMPSPCVSRLGQPYLGVCDSSGDKKIRGQASPQDATVYSEPTQSSKGPPGPVVQPMAPAEDGGLALGASVPCQTWFRGIAPGMPQGPVATGLLLSMCQKENPTPMAVVTTGVGQGPCPAVLPSEFFPPHLGTSFPQTCTDPQLLSVATVVSPGCQYAGVDFPEAAVAPVGGALVQGSVDGNVPLALVPKPVVESEALSLPQGSVIRGIGKSVPPESMVDVKAQNLPLESVVSSEIRRPYQDAMASDVAFPPGSVVTGMAPSHPQETSGNKEKPLPRSHSPGPHPGSVANGIGPSMPLGSVAPASMLAGISPRPYQATEAGEGSWVPFLSPHVINLASVPEVQRVAQDQQHLPRVLLSASQFSQDPGLTKLVGVDNPTLPKLREVDMVSWTLESGIDTVKSEGLKIIPRTGLGTMGGKSHELAALAKEAPSQASGITSVPVQAPSLGEHPKANSITSVQPLSSESSNGPPSIHPASGHPSLQEVPVVGSSSLPPASNVILVPPQLSSGIAGIAKWPLESEVSAGDPSILQSSGGTNLAPPTKNRASGVSQMGEPQHHTAARTSSRFIRGSLVSELLEGSMGRLLHFSSPLKPASQLSSESHKQSSGSPMVGDGRGQKACTGVQGMSPNGSRRPLLDEAAHDTIHSGQPGTGPTLITHPGQKPTFVTGPGVGYDGGSQIPTAPHGYKYHVTVPKTSFDKGPRKVPAMLYGHRLQYITMPKTSLDGTSQARTTAHSQTPQTGFGSVSHAYTRHGHNPHLVTHPKTGHNKVSPPLTVPQGPVDAGLAASQSWNTKVPNVPARAAASAGPPQGPWHPSRGHRPWDPSGAEAALDHKPSAELLVSICAMEKVVLEAVVTIQACARGYLVRRTVKLWHQWATVIQATWRGYRVRRNLARLLRATTVIQAAWRGYCIRRDRAHQVLLPTMWPEHRGRAQGTSDTRNSSEHRCFLSCQPNVCSVCQALGPRVASPPSVVMLVGSQPRTCHVCGHTLSTRVVQGFGQGISGQSGSRWAVPPAQCPLLSQQHRAATLIQAAWKGYRTRRQLSQQQSAAKMVQATWRGHYTRSCLTTDALLGTGGPWNISRETSRRTSRACSLHWPGV